MHNYDICSKLNPKLCSRMHNFKGNMHFQSGCEICCSDVVVRMAHLPGLILNKYIYLSFIQILNFQNGDKWKDISLPHWVLSFQIIWKLLNFWKTNLSTKNFFSGNSRRKSNGTKIPQWKKYIGIPCKVLFSGNSGKCCFIRQGQFLDMQMKMFGPMESAHWQTWNHVVLLHCSTGENYANNITNWSTTKRMFVILKCLICAVRISARYGEPIFWAHLCNIGWPKRWWTNL